MFACTLLQDIQLLPSDCETEQVHLMHTNCVKLNNVFWIMLYFSNVNFIFTKGT